MNPRIFNSKNLIRALIFGIITFLLYGLVDVIFGDEVDLKSNTIKSFIMFLIYMLLGSSDVTWKELFMGKKALKK